MLRQGSAHAHEREKVLADGMKEVAAELRLIDPADLVAFIRTERYGNIRTLVNAATELYFKPGIISFAGGVPNAEIVPPWPKLSALRLTAITISAPSARAADTGTGLTSAPSTSQRSPIITGEKMPGSA